MTASQPKSRSPQTRRPDRSPAPMYRDLPDPLWLKGLMVTQNLTILSALVLVGTLLAVYGWSVHTQAQWNREYQKLQLLKRQERKLSAAIETFENEMVANLQRYTGSLVREDRSQSLYLNAPPPAPTPPTPRPDPAPIRPIRGY
jgi:hypothetical protein